MTITHDFDEPDFLNKKKKKEVDKKLETGEITCNTDNPDECETCSG